MPRLTTLKPGIPTLKPGIIKTLDTKAGATARQRGYTWMNTRDRVAKAGGYRCAGCGCVWFPDRDHVDHKVPLEQGGSNDDSNLQLLCADPCHKAKTAAEAAARARG